MNTKKEVSTIHDTIDNFFFCNVGAKTNVEPKKIRHRLLKKQTKIDYTNTVIKNKNNLFQPTK